MKHIRTAPDGYNVWMADGDVDDCEHGMKLSIYELIIIAVALALVMLALTAAYGVYEFQVTFTPPWVAFVSAAMEVRRWRCGDETNYG